MLFKSSIASVFAILIMLTLLGILVGSTLSLKSDEHQLLHSVLLREKRSPFLKKFWKHRGGNQYYNQYNSVYQTGPGYHQPHGGAYGNGHQGNSYSHAQAQAVSGTFNNGRHQSASFSSASAFASASNGK